MLVEEIEKNVRQVDISNEELLFNEIQIVKAKISSITPKKQERKKRGLIKKNQTGHN